MEKGKGWYGEGIAGFPSSKFYPTNIVRKLVAEEHPSIQ
jgi:hypothetical protein